MYAYVGSRTTRERNARGEGITVFRVDPVDGGLEPTQVVGDLVNPSYLALNRDGTRLYTVHGDRSDVSAFAIDPATGHLTWLNTRDTRGRNPVHLALDPSGRHLVVTNHLGASVVVLPINADGSLAPLTQMVSFSGEVGPHRVEQQQAKPHFNPFDPSGRFVIVPDKGLDKVFSFRFDAGVLTPSEVAYVQAREGAGPRNAVFHPHLARAYVVNELDSTVTTYGFDTVCGALTPMHIVSTLPASYTGNSRAGGIAIDGAGGVLYASNRGHDSIAAFALDKVSGLPAFIAASKTVGRTPRFFTLAPNGRLLYALNEDSDTIVAMYIDPENGQMCPTGSPTACGSPVCMVFSAVK